MGDEGCMCVSCRRERMDAARGYRDVTDPFPVECLRCGAYVVTEWRHTLWHDEQDDDNP